MKIFQERSYKVINDKTVECQIKAAVFYADEFLYGDPNDFEDLCKSEDAYVYTVKAKAVCNKSDKFDETTGKHIAENKAFIKLIKIIRSTIRLMKKELNTKLNYLELDSNKVDRLIDNQVKHLNEVK